MLSIEIPPSVHTLGNEAITFFNLSSQFRSVNCHLVIFKRHSKLRMIENYTFQYAKQVSLIFESKVNPNVILPIFHEVGTVYIYCNSLIKIGNYSSVPVDNCSIIIEKSTNYWLFMLPIILLD